MNLCKWVLPRAGGKEDMSDNNGEGEGEGW